MDALDQQAARCLIAGIAGTEPTADELELVRRGIGGVILFARNVESPRQVAELSRTLKAAAPGPLLLSVDQEGGRVQRLRPPHWTQIPSMRRIGAIDEAGGAAGQSGPAIADKLGRLVGKELAACGIDLNYAPVVDVDTNPKNPVIGDRSFGREEARVARLATAFAKGMEAVGVASCAKHYPGHGDTSQDSHKTLPRLAHDLSRLWECELVPFVAAARAGLASVMTAHVLFEAFDRLPATLSPKALGLLRYEVGFRGACISDDLEMAAVVERYGVVDSAALAIAAGCDVVLVCHTLALQHEAIDSIARAARSGPLLRERLAEAADRALTLQRFARAAPSIDPAHAASACATPESRAFVETLVEHGDGQAARLHDPTERAPATERSPS
jgi:beta-N-acetylhexosaminidase